MPRGTRHRLTGLLRPGKLDPVLQIDGGGEWRLDCDCRYEHLLGRRVDVHGVRSEFDLLLVERIWQHGMPVPPPRTSILTTILRMFGR